MIYREEREKIFFRLFRLLTKNVQICSGTGDFTNVGVEIETEEVVLGRRRSRDENVLGNSLGVPLGGNGSVVAPLSDGRSSSLVPLSLGRPFGGPLGNGLSRARSDIVVGCTVSRLPGRSSVLGDLAARGLLALLDSSLSVSRLNLDLSLSSRSTAVRSTSANEIVLVIVVNFLLPRGRESSSVVAVVRVVDDRVLVVVVRVDVDVVSVSLNVRRSGGRFRLRTENVDVSEIEESALVRESGDIVTVTSDVGGSLMVLGVVSDNVQIEVVQNVVEESSLPKVAKSTLLSDGEDLVAVSNDVGSSLVVL